MTTTTMANNIHEGQNIKRFREILGIKQDTLASLLGPGWNQQKVSLLEQNETVDPPVLDSVSKVLKVPVEALRSFVGDAASNFINSFYDQSGFNYHCTFNPLDKVVELYERMLKAERDKSELLEKLLAEKGKK